MHLLCTQGELPKGHPRRVLWGMCIVSSMGFCHTLPKGVMPIDTPTSKFPLVPHLHQDVMLSGGVSSSRLGMRSHPIVVLICTSSLLVGSDTFQWLLPRVEQVFPSLHLPFLSFAHFFHWATCAWLINRWWSFHVLDTSTLLCGCSPSSGPGHAFYVFSSAVIALS